MASNVGMIAIGVLLGAMFGYAFHSQIQQVLGQAGTLGLGKVGYAYQGRSSCGCGR